MINLELFSVGSDAHVHHGTFKGCDCRVKNVIRSTVTGTVLCYEVSLYGRALRSQFAQVYPLNLIKDWSEKQVAHMEELNPSSVKDYFKNRKGRK